MPQLGSFVVRRVIVALHHLCASCIGALISKLKTIHGIAPLYIQYLVQVKSQGAYNVRSSRAVLLDAPSLRELQVAAPKLWNSLPSELRLIDNFDIFKRHLKMYLCISKEK